MGHNIYIVTRYKPSGGLDAVIRDADPRCFAMVMWVAVAVWAAVFTAMVVSPVARH